MLTLTPSTPLNYDFAVPQRIVFGWGRRTEVGLLARSLGRRALIVSGSQTLAKNGTLAAIAKLLADAGVESLVLETITREPEVEDVDRTVARLREIEPQPSDMVIAIGGGSAIDLAKAVAALATNTEGSSVADYLEGVGRGLKIEKRPLPLLAMPTTAGTGSEATKNAVISSRDPLFKKSLRSDLMLPRVVLVDPELTVSAPAKVTAHTGMDAITQLVESFISSRARPIAQALCLQGLELAVPSIWDAVMQPDQRVARERMAHAALLSGMALANSGLGMAHGVAAALGVHCNVPHGLACAVMLPTAMRINADVRRKEIACLGRLFSNDATLSERDAVQAAFVLIEKISIRLGIPQQLSELGVTRDQIPALVASSQGNSMNGNPRPISDAELTRILERML